MLLEAPATSSVMAQVIIEWSTVIFGAKYWRDEGGGHLQSAPSWIQFFFVFHSADDVHRRSFVICWDFIDSTILPVMKSKDGPVVPHVCCTLLMEWNDACVFSIWQAIYLVREEARESLSQLSCTASTQSWVNFIRPRNFWGWVVLRRRGTCSCSSDTTVSWYAVRIGIIGGCLCGSGTWIFNAKYKAEIITLYLFTGGSSRLMRLPDGPSLRFTRTWRRYCLSSLSSRYLLSPVR